MNGRTRTDCSERQSPSTLRALLFFVVAVVICGAVSQAQVDPRNALLERAGWDALIAGQPHAAAESFRQAIASDPKNPRLHLGAGTAAYLERRDSDAKEALDYALALDPRMTRARALLGQVLHRSGDLLGAIRAYEMLTTESPDDKEALAVLDRWRREAALHDRMQQAVGQHFTVSFEGPAEAALAAKALDSLERAYWRIGDALGTYPAEPIAVVLYTGEQFRDITRSPQWAAGAYDGTIRVPMRGALDNEKELDRVLAHEFTHALVRTLAAHGVPTWLNEGLAAALESGDLKWAERQLRQAAAPVSLASLQASFGRFGDDQAQLAYATSAMAVRVILEEAGGFAVANLLRDLGDGVDFDAAFTHRIQRTFVDFQASLAAK
jgi:tetratricopeptide (TPR) repeat protein